MSEQDKTTLKTYFQAGDRPTEQQFVDLIDSVGLQSAIDSIEEAQQSGVIGYETKSEMDADTSRDDGTLALVTNDSTTSNNGWYRWDAGTSSWIKRDDFYATVLDDTDTSEAVTGKAVGDYVFPNRGPFEKDATLSGVEYLYNAIKGARLFNINDEEFHISWIDRNYSGTNQTWQIRIANSQGNVVCTFSETDYVEPSGIDRVFLESSGAAGIVGYVWIDWTEIPDGTRENGITSEQSKISYENYSNRATQVNPEDTSEAVTGKAVSDYVFLNAPFAHPDNQISTGEMLNIYQAISEVRLYTQEEGEEYYVYRFNYHGGQVPDSIRIGIRRVSDDAIVAFSSTPTYPLFSNTQTFEISEFEGSGIYAEIDLDGSILNPVETGPTGTEFKLSTQTYCIPNRLKESKGLTVHHFEGDRSDALRVVSKYDETRDFILDFDEFGYNTMYGFASMKLKDNIKPYPDRYGAQMGETSNILSDIVSDWIGPHVVAAQNNPLNTYDPTFTGGNHNFRKEGETEQTGNPTAREDVIEFYADGEKVQKGNVYQADRVDIYIENAVTGFNTMQQDGVQGDGGSGRPVITERIHYTVRPKFGKGIAVEVMVEIEALEAVDYYLYYGLQTMYNFHNGTVHFSRGEAQGRQDNSGNGVSSESRSGDKSLFPDVDRINLRSVDNDHDLICWLDRSFGLGDMALNTAGYHAMCVNNVNKSYWGLIFDGSDAINTIDTSLNAGERIYWRGGYVFQPNDEGSADTDLTAVLPKGNSITSYADFFSAGERDVPMPKNVQFKEVTDVNTSSSITVGDKIVPSGLNLLSTGYGVSEVSIE